MAEEKKDSDSAKAMSDDKPKAEEKSAQATYSQTQLLTYSGIAALVGGVIGYFIGEHRGEKKSNEKFEKAINKLLSAKSKKSRNTDSNDESDTVFEL